MAETQQNGRMGEWVRWALLLIAAGVVSYFTTIGTLSTQLAMVEERQRNHFDEIQRSLSRIENDVRDLRNRRP